MYYSVLIHWTASHVGQGYLFKYQYMNSLPIYPYSDWLWLKLLLTDVPASIQGPEDVHPGIGFLHLIPSNGVSAMWLGAIF